MSRNTLANSFVLIVTIGMVGLPAAAQKPGTWMTTGGMSTARQIHWAVLLTDGKVLRRARWRAWFWSRADLITITYTNQCRNL